MLEKDPVAQKHMAKVFIHQTSAPLLEPEGARRDNFYNGHGRTIQSVICDGRSMRKDLYGCLVTVVNTGEAKVI